MSVENPVTDFEKWLAEARRDQGRYDAYRQAWEESRTGQDWMAERSQAASWDRQVYADQQDYRNRALAQQGASSRAANETSRANAALSARTQLKQQKMQIDAQYRTFRERLNELEIPTLHLDAWYKQQQIGLAKANLELEARGPRNAFQYVSAMRQTSGTPNLPASLAAMARNQPLAAYEGQSGNPEAMSFSDLASKYGFGDGAGGAGGVQQSDIDRENAALAAMRTVAERGPQGMGLGVYDSMTDYEKAVFNSGLEKLGYDAGDWEQRMRRAAPGQGNPMAA